MNPSPDQPSQLEPMPVQLTRMEGTLNLVDFKVSDLGARMEGVERRVTAVEIVQAQQSGASSSWRMWLPTILTGLGVLAALGLGIHFGG